MQWFWIAFTVVWTAIAVAAALGMWGLTQRMLARGWISNGLGHTVKKKENPTGFWFLLAIYRLLAALFAFFAVFGAIATIIRIGAVL